MTRSAASPARRHQAGEPPAGNTSPAAAATVSIAARESALFAPELRAFVAGLHDPTTRGAYVGLLAAVEAGLVGAEQVDLLGSFLELGLTTGRFKARLGLQAEEGIRRVYEKTPRGAAQASSAVAVTSALAGLVDQTIRDLRITLVRPGTYRLVVETDRYRVLVGLAPAGATVESVELTV